MALVFYKREVASDGPDMKPVRDGVFQVFELDDPNGTRPLPLYDMRNALISSLETTSWGTFPDVQVDSPNFSHWFKSGSFVWRRDSFDRAEKIIEENRAAAEKAASSAKRSSTAAERASIAAEEARNTAERIAVEIEAPTDLQVDLGIQRAGLPAIVTKVLAADETVAYAAAEATATAVEEADLVTGSDSRMIQVSSHPTYAYLLMDGNDRFAFAVRHNGIVEIPKLDLTNVAARIGSEFDAATKSDPTRVFAFGDSITEGGSPTPHWPTVLQSLLPGGTSVTNRGVSGQQAADIALRQGALKMFLTVAGEGIPPAGGASCTYTLSITPANLRAYTIKGSLAGIQGSLAYTPDGKATFTRSSEGALVPVAAGTPFIPEHSLNGRNGLNIFWAGRNDVGYNETNYDQSILGCTKAMVNHLNPEVKRFLVLSVLTTTAETKALSTSGYWRAQKVNEALKAEYPHQYVDMRRHIIDHGLSLTGITPTQADRDAIAADTLPPSLMSDQTHPNPTCKEFVIAPKIREELASRGWL